MEDLLLSGDIWAWICAIPAWIWVVGFGIIQLYFFIKTLNKLNRFNGYFSDSTKWSVENSDSSIEVSDSSKEMSQLVREINEYLKKNEGTADFGIIKDKVQSRIDSLYEDATSKVSFPTYLGLMGTFFGVWIGLSSFKEGVAINGVTNEIVADLISGVIVSMVTSLVGLVLMMWGNGKANTSLKKVEEGKNKFFDFIQVNLMPRLGTSMVNALDKLHKTVNSFEPAFKGIINEFKGAFDKCTESLRGAFGEKVQLLTDAVEKMGDNMSLINKNVQLQEQLLTKMSQKDTIRTLQSFVAAADKFDNVTTSIAQLSDVKDAITASSTTLVEAQSNFIDQMAIPERVFDKINAILNRIVTFEQSLNDLGESIAKTQLLGNSQMNLIQEQITAIQKKTDLTIQYQETSEEELKKVYNSQIAAIKSLNQGYDRAIEEHGNDFAKVMNGFRTNFEKIVKECMDAVESLRNEYFAEIHKSLDFDATNQHLSKLDDIPNLINILSEVQTYIQGQPEISNKWVSLSKQIIDINSTLASMEKKIGTPREVSVDTSIQGEQPKQKRRGLRIFRRRKK